jgi:superfamily II RNA helicase
MQHNHNSVNRSGNKRQTPEGGSVENQQQSKRQRVSDSNSTQTTTYQQLQNQQYQQYQQQQYLQHQYELQQQYLQQQYQQQQYQQQQQYLQQQYQLQRSSKEEITKFLNDLQQCEPKNVKKLLKNNPTIVQNFRNLDGKEVIAAFRCVLMTDDSELINIFWNNNNKIKTAILAMHEINQGNLLKRVLRISTKMSENDKRNDDFISDYIFWYIGSQHSESKIDYALTIIEEGIDLINGSNIAFKQERIADLKIAKDELLQKKINIEVSGHVELWIQ